MSPPSTYNPRTSDEEKSLIEACEQRIYRFRPTIFQIPPSVGLVGSLKEEYNQQRHDKYRNVSFTEMVAFTCESASELFDLEKDRICSDDFGFDVIEGSDNLVFYYTGLLSSNQFYSLNNMLETRLGDEYVQWEESEMLGFKNHTLLTLMKLRLNLTDQELAARFHVEIHVVKMTLLEWLPVLNESVYETCRFFFCFPEPDLEEPFTKVVDVAEFCYQLPDSLGKWRDMREDRRKAVLTVRSDGFICYVSRPYNVNKPDEDILLTSDFCTSLVDSDVVHVHPEHITATSSLGAICHDEVTDRGIAIMEEAATRISLFRILQAIPKDYVSFSGLIIRLCATLSNFQVI